MSDSLTLYEVETELQEAYERVLELQQVGNEEELASALTILEAYLTESSNKRDRCGKFFESLAAMEASIDGEIKRLGDRKKRLSTVREQMQKYILMVMERIEVKKLEGQLFTFKVAKNPPKVLIEDELLIPSEYLVTPPTPPPTIDKKAIKEDIVKRNVNVPGARVVQENRLVIE